MSRDAVVDAVATTVDVVADQVETLERIPNLALNGTTTRQQIVILTATTLTGLAVGVVATAFVSRKHFKMKYEKIAEEEIEKSRDYYRTLKEKPDLAKMADAILDYEEPEQGSEEPNTDPESAAMMDAARDIVETKGYTSYDQGTKAVKPAPVPPVVQNVFAQVSSTEELGEYDEDAELEKRSKGRPYIIEEEEYLENGTAYPQVHVTWYEEDSVLADEKDSVITDVATILGADNFVFGYGTKDPNTVFIRNDRYNTDYEVTRVDGSYAKLVHGFESPRESGKNNRRMRTRDDAY